MSSEQTILVSGYAQAPKGTPMYEVHKWAGVVLEIDVSSNRIVAAECLLLTSLARDFCARLLVGYDLSAGLDPLIELMTARLQTPSRDSIVVAVRTAVQRYMEFRRQRFA